MALRNGVGRIRGSTPHRIYTVTVFIVLAALDNVAIGLVPPLYSPISDDLDVHEAAVGGATAASFLVTAVAALGWAYLGDRTSRKPLLMIGTLIWAAGTAGTAFAVNYQAFLGAQLLGAVGLGTVASVGFSVVSDLISPRRRGLVMSLWGLSQGAGTLSGTLLGGLVGATDWRRPFLVLTVVALVATFAYLFTHSIQRGASEPELTPLFEAGGEYDHRISRADVPGIVRRRTNVWLVLQGLTAQVAFGSLVWLPRLIQAKAEAQGYPQEAAIVVGSVFATLFQLGGVLSIVGGLVGDRLQRRTPRGRAMVASVGILTAIPFYLVLFFLPLDADIPVDQGTRSVVLAVVASLVTEPMIGVTFLLALIAFAATSANAPNWYALIADVNPPEHRGTVFGAGNLVNGVGRAVGNGLVGVVFRAMQTALPPPMNYAVGLALFQLFFIPTGIMYWMASRSSPRDIATTRRIMRRRAGQPVSGGRGESSVHNAPAKPAVGDDPDMS